MAGGAAHQTPPFMGQGMAAGIRDAANLAWKLNESIQHNNLGLIESYHSERLSHVTEFVNGAVNFGKIIQNYCEDAEFQQQVNQLKNFITPTPQLGQGLYITGDKLSGQISPQFLLINDQLSDEIVGYQYALFIHQQFKHLIADLNLDHTENLVTLIGDSTQPKQWLEDNQAIAILVRPDRYVFGQANNRKTLEDLMKAANLYDLAII